MVLRLWGILQNNLVLATELIMQIGHRKEFLESTFQSLDHPHSLWRWAKLIKTKLFCNGLRVILGYN